MREMKTLHTIAGALLVTLCAPVCLTYAQAPPVVTVWQKLGIPQAFKSMQGNLINRRGNLPGLEPKPPLLGIADPANLESEVPAIKAAAEIKQQEDMAAQKIKGIKYLAGIGCGCYNKDGSITDALLAALDDCTEKVRFETVKAIGEVAKDEACENCKLKACCSEQIVKRLAELAYEKGDACCWLEPSERVREAAMEAMNSCCPGGPLDYEPAPDVVPVPERETVTEPEAASSARRNVPSRLNNLNPASWYRDGLQSQTKTRPAVPAPRNATLEQRQPVNSKLDSQKRASLSATTRRFFSSVITTPRRASDATKVALTSENKLTSTTASRLKSLWTASDRVTTRNTVGQQTATKQTATKQTATKQAATKQVTKQVTKLSSTAVIASISDSKTTKNSDPFAKTTSQSKSPLRAPAVDLVGDLELDQPNDLGKMFKFKATAESKGSQLALKKPAAGISFDDLDVEAPPAKNATQHLARRSNKADSFTTPIQVRESKTTRATRVSLVTSRDTEKKAAPAVHLDFLKKKSINVKPQRIAAGTTGRVNRVNPTSGAINLTFADHKTIPVGTVLQVEHQYLLGTTILGEVEIVSSRAGVATAQPVGAIRVSKVSRGDRVITR
jgi:hypothetical protein